MWHINTRSCRLGCLWLPALLHDAWMQLSPLCEKWESAYSTTSTTGSFLPSFNIAQDPPPQQLRLPGARGQLCQEHNVTQPMSFVPGHSYRLSADDSNCLSGASHDNLASRGLLQGSSKLSRKCWALWQRLRRYFRWVCFPCDPSSCG